MLRKTPSSLMLDGRSGARTFHDIKATGAVAAQIGSRFLIFRNEAVYRAATSDF
jgi:hypothetical protein